MEKDGLGTMEGGGGGLLKRGEKVEDVGIREYLGGPRVDGSGRIGRSDDTRFGSGRGGGGGFAAGMIFL